MHYNETRQNTFKIKHLKESFDFFLKSIIFSSEKAYIRFSLKANLNYIMLAHCEVKSTSTIF